MYRCSTNLIVNMLFTSSPLLLAVDTVTLMTQDPFINCHIRDILHYFHSRISHLFDDRLCTMNMHLLLHLGDQVQQFGSLPFCSMFSFEHQFWNFKLYCQGNTSLLKQICEKLMLIKRCKSFLELSKYEKKDELLKTLNAKSTEGNNQPLFLDTGHVLYKSLDFYSSDYKRKSSHLCTVYQIKSSDTRNFEFVNVLRFNNSLDDVITVDVNFFILRDIPMLQFHDFGLPNVPDHIVNLISEQQFYFVGSLSSVKKSVPFDSLLFPCVIVKDFDPNVDPSFFLIIPSSSVFEFN